MCNPMQSSLTITNNASTPLNINYPSCLGNFFQCPPDGFDYDSSNDSMSVGVGKTTAPAAMCDSFTEMLIASYDVNGQIYGFTISYDASNFKWTSTISDNSPSRQNQYSVYLNGGPGGYTLVLNEAIPPSGTTITIPGYQVKSGDTLYNVAKIFKPTDPNGMVNILIDSNQQNIGPLSVGESINLPSGATYTVQTGDSLFSIAQKNNIPHWESIIAANIGQSLFPFVPNQTVLCLPNVLLSAYVVQSGDSMYKIAASYSISINDLMQMNNLTLPDINIGQVLGVPPSTNVFPYVVKSGDTLYKIGQQYGITTTPNLSSFATLNDLDLNNPNFSPGQILLLPLPSNETGYLVQSGDSFSSIAAANNISVGDLEKWNTWVSASTLAPGDVLIVGKTS